MHSPTRLLAPVPSGGARGPYRWHSLAAVCLLAAGQLAAPAAERCEAPTGPDVWAVSSRGGGDPTERVQHYVLGQGWKRSDAGALFDGDGRTLVLLVHGNRYEHADALDQALRLARWLGTCADGTRPAPRVVAYSWPSDKQGTPLRDSRRKYERASLEVRRFAGLLERIEPQRPVGIVGYSYGALVALGGLAARVGADGDAAGGPRGWALRESPVNLVLVAAAVRCDALAPAGPYRSAAAIVDRVVLLNNSSDIALRFFPWVDRGLETDALGRVGMPARWLPEGVEFRQYDAADAVGVSHRFLGYLESAGVARRLCAGLVDGAAAE